MAADLLSAALEYASLGWPVFPCNPKNKRPLVEHGLKAATTDADTISAWWAKFPKAMIGVVTGEVSGLVVLDIDLDEAKGLDGAAELSRLLNGAGVTETLTARTPRGGQHLYFAHPHDRVIRNSASKLGLGLDVRGDGGYVIAPPSVNAAGKAYCWKPSWRPVGPCPKWMLSEPEPRRPKANGHDTSARRAYGEKAVRAECDRVACAPEGRRNAELFRSGARLFELVAGGVLTETEVRNALWSAARACGLDDDEIGKTLDSAHEHGSQQPRGPRPTEDSNRKYRPQPDHNGSGGTNGHAGEPSDIYDAADLRFQTFAPLQQIAGEIIVEGLTVLAARPKVGKTWLCLDIAIAVSEGGYCLGDIQCDQGDVLYLALEDNPRRLQRRLTKLLGVHKREWPRRLHIAHKWSRSDQGGLDQLRNWISSAKNPRLIVIDVFARFRKPVPAGKQNYDTDYASISELQNLAAETGVAIVIVHHLRKSEADDDPLDTVSGTLGLTAAADAILVIQKTSQGTSLYGRSRDTDEIDKAVKFDPDSARWTMLGERDDVQRSAERRAILNLLEEAGGPMAPKDIAAALGRKDGSIRFLLSQMVKAGEITKPGYGVYAISPSPANSPNTANTGTEGGSETQQNQGFWWNRDC